MRLTFRAKLLAIVATAATGFIVLVMANLFLTRQVEQELKRVEAVYVPMLELRPTLERGLEGISRGFQDAVAARDPELVSDVRNRKETFLTRLASAERAIEPAKAAALRVALEEYHDTARSVSLRLIEGETGEALPHAIAEMQDRQKSVREALQNATRFDRQELADALGRVNHAHTTAFRIRLLVILTCLTLVVSLSAWVVTGLVGAVRELTDGFERFGKGQFDTPIVAAGSDDELAAVARGANRMAESLRHTVSELEAFNYSVSHDLRAPLRPLDGFSQALLEDYGAQLDPKAQDYLKRIRAAAQRMSQLIEDMLQLSRLGRAELTMRPFDMAPLAEGIIAELRRNDPARVVEFVSVGQAKAEGDSRLMRIVLENLLRNAWKFSRRVPAARIELGAREESGQTVYYVRDNGAGFDPQYSHKLFQPFQRLHIPADFDGTGIGLAIVQRIVRRHGGRVWAEAAPGAGATFFFTLHDGASDRQAVT